MAIIAFFPSLPVRARRCQSLPIRTSRPPPEPQTTSRPKPQPATASLAQDAALSSATIASASAALYALQQATSAGLLSTKLNRKLVHIATGPVLLFLWPFYSGEYGSRAIAAVVPLFFIARLAYSVSRSTPFALAVSRTADATEASKGPLLYVIVIFTATLFAFRTPIGCVAVTQLAFGDGLADIVGRNFGEGTEWRQDGGKTVVGSAAFAGGAFWGSLALLAWFEKTGILGGRLDASSVAAVGFISVVCAAAEVLLQDLVDDNLTIPAIAAGLSVLLLPTLRAL